MDQASSSLRLAGGYRVVKGFLWAFVSIGIALLLIELWMLVEGGGQLRPVRHFIAQMVFPVLPLFVGGLIGLYYVIPRFERRDQLYTAGLRQSLPENLATQPQPANEAEARLPMVVKLRLQALGNILLVGAMMLIVGGVVTARSALEGDLDRLFVVAELVAGAVLIAVIGLAVAWTYEEITLTERTLTFERVTLVDRTIFTVELAQARLFAIVEGSQRWPSIMFYVLAERETQVNFPIITMPPRWYTMAKPDMPFEEYERRMWELLGYIRERTGLPLLDLR